MKMSIVMDGTEYRVGVVFDTIIRSFEIASGENAGEMLSGREELDTIGTRYSYQLQVEPDPPHRADYDAFYEAISDPANRVHEITLPYGQGTITYKAYVTSGQDSYGGPRDGGEAWSGLVVNYRPVAPQRRADN